MSTQTNFQHLDYHIWIKEKQQKYLLQPCALNLVYIPSLWKWWIVAMSKLFMNLMHIFLLYVFLNLLVYFETRAWNKTFVGSKCLSPNLGCWLVWYVETMLILLYLIVWWNLGWFLLKIKQGKFLNGHITYQSHMPISKYKPSTYACLWPI
jgi:hypothetical protein